MKRLPRQTPCTKRLHYLFEEKEIPCKTTEWVAHFPEGAYLTQRRKLTGLFPTNALVMRQSEAKGKYQNH